MRTIKVTILTDSLGIGFVTADGGCGVEEMAGGGGGGGGIGTSG